MKFSGALNIETDLKNHQLNEVYWNFAYSKYLHSSIVFINKTNYKSVKSLRSQLLSSGQKRN